MSQDDIDRAIASGQVEDNRPADRFEFRVGEDVASLTYRTGEASIALLHVEVPPALEGRGIAAILSKHALDFARDRSLTVSVHCSYVSAYVDRHPEYQDLVGR